MQSRPDLQVRQDPTRSRPIVVSIVRPTRGVATLTSRTVTSNGIATRAVPNPSVEWTSAEINTIAMTVNNSIFSHQEAQRNSSYQRLKSNGVSKPASQSSVTGFNLPWLVSSTARQPG